MGGVMKRLRARVISLSALMVMAADNDDALYQQKLVDLGTALFFDVTLSRDKTQSCASCHD